MINWEKYNDIKIDEYAKLQFEHYFNDIGKILDDQKLSDKKWEIFADLEDHIIDHIRSHSINSISFKESLQIIAELGPPEEYTDFSSLPSLVEEIEKHEKVNVNIGLKKAKISNSIVLCSHCNSKNEKDSAFCVNCGASLTNKIINTEKWPSSPLFNAFKKYPEYFLSLLSFVLFSVMLFNYFYYTEPYESFFSLIIILFGVNEFLVIPFIILYRLLRTSYTRFVLASFWLSYALKIVVLITIIVLLGFDFKPFNPWTRIIIELSILLVTPVLLTKILFFSGFSKKLSLLLSKKVNSSSKMVYVFGILFYEFLFVITIFIGNAQVFILNIPISEVIQLILLGFLVLFALFILVDFIFVSKILQEKKVTINTDFSYDFPHPVNNGSDFARKILAHAELILFIALSCNIGIFFLYLEAVSLNQMKNFFGYFYILFTIFILIFISLDFYFTYYYRRSSNIFMLTLGVYFFDFTIYYMYIMYTVQFAFLWHGDYTSVFYKGIPILLTLFILVTALIFPVLSILVLKNERMKHLNELSFSNNKILNRILFGSYFVLVFFVLNLYPSSNFYSGLTFFLGLSLLLLIKPFFNIINYFMMYKLNIQKYPSKLVQQ